MFSSAAPEFTAQGGAGGTPWGPGAEAESCTHPAKHDRCFTPPIAERQRLPNLGIDYAHVSNIVFIRALQILRYNIYSVFGDKPWYSVMLVEYCNPYAYVHHLHNTVQFLKFGNG